MAKVKWEVKSQWHPGAKSFHWDLLRDGKKVAGGYAKTEKQCKAFAAEAKNELVPEEG